jgi:hypothetical protein
MHDTWFTVASITKNDYLMPTSALPCHILLLYLLYFCLPFFHPFLPFHQSNIINWNVHHEMRMSERANEIVVYRKIAHIIWRMSSSSSSSSTIVNVNCKDVIKLYKENYFLCYFFLLGNDDTTIYYIIAIGNTSHVLTIKLFAGCCCVIAVLFCANENFLFETNKQTGWGEMWKKNKIVNILLPFSLT